MILWQPNTGRAPYRDEEDGPPILRVFVRLRNGLEPSDSWPVSTGRRETTDWKLSRHPFDIVEWREA